MSNEKLRLKTTDKLIQVIVDLNTHLSEREAVIAERDREIEQLRIQSLDAFDKQRERYEREIAAVRAEYAKYRREFGEQATKIMDENAALKSKLGEAEKALKYYAGAMCPHGSVIGGRATEALSSLRPKTSGSDGEGFIHGGTNYSGKPTLDEMQGIFKETPSDGEGKS